MKFRMLGLPRVLIIAAAASLALTAIAEARVLKVQTSQNAGDFTFEHLNNVWAPNSRR